MPKSTYILAISGGMDDELVTIGVADVKEADINYLLLVRVRKQQVKNESAREHI
jgi:hypothetical protein